MDGGNFFSFQSSAHYAREDSDDEIEVYPDDDADEKQAHRHFRAIPEERMTKVRKICQVKIRKFQISTLLHIHQNVFVQQ